MLATREALRFEAYQEIEDAGEVGPAELSVVLCSDKHITQLNSEWRNKAEPTDVLSFGMDMDASDGYPVRLLGDLVISLDTAEQQAQERGYGLLDECRVLLVHGLLHLLGYDHEIGVEEATAMAAAERHILDTLGWKGEGLIAAAESSSATDGISREEADDVISRGISRQGDSDVEASTSYSMESGTRTLLDARSKVLPSSVQALRAAINAGVRICLATGKARPAAIAAMQPVGLAGEGLVVSSKGPGIFLQGLAVHGKDGALLPGEDLPGSIVQSAFQYSVERGVPLCAFLGDTCATLRMTDELQDLHQTYYEPLARVASSLDEILAGPPVKKLLFMTDPSIVDRQLRPHWEAALEGRGAEVMQAVPTMLELVPRGVNKWVGLQALLLDLDLPREAVMAIGDGGNDLHIVANAGLGVAMGNAMPVVKEAAAVVVANNDEDGVAEAIERFVL
ncbi:HAD-like protein [Coccomyxa subellipsoidea C-169]|uniref:HAD-like protein n=1 Tax=Coccomyxa subellipsoidea (strain C-169) TaxID=574566 RepID=I0Z981_COCSC|nr:HAD-like protein [Coccomyxa subellipsoidea C-169]EIE27200.1 HAD-like protein [Coccomyxa subellipsoidea C-169]|eukprot:XP_005651744.1 HAD-like protein [Coccomyxa subellipsoidea C-169]